jgi:hypothetical protein
MKKLLLAALLLTGCASNQLHKDVEIGNEAVKMMQCKILCDGKDKPYGFSEADLNCQCQRPVDRNIASESPILRFEIVAPKGSGEQSVRGVMGDMVNGKRIMSVVPQGGE